MFNPIKKRIRFLVMNNRVVFQILFRENEDYSYTGGGSASLLLLNLGRDEYSHEQLGCLSLHFSILVNSPILSLSLSLGY